MEREELIQLWMALGLVQADDARHKEMEDVGDDIFQILVSNSLFQDVERDKYGHISHCSMHDLSLSLSIRESFCVVDATNVDTDPIPHVKHLAFYQEQNTHEIFKLIENHMTARTLQTLFFCGELGNSIPFQRFRCMRVLKLKGSGIRKIDDTIGELVHLRYLDLSYTEITGLPESIGKLYHLQTLKLKNCYRLNKYPTSMRNLISLRYCKSDKYIPTNIVRHLTSLHTKEPYAFSAYREKGHEIEVLSRLKHFGGRNLSLFNLQKISSKEDVVKTDLSSKKKLNGVEFHWYWDKEGANENDKEVLEILQPPRDVKVLEIYGFSSDNFSEWVMKMAVHIEGKWTPLDKLVEIILSECKRCRSLPTLEHLPHLRVLELKRMDSLVCLGNCDNKLTGSTKPLSPSLRSLRLTRMERLEK